VRWLTALGLAAAMAVGAAVRLIGLGYGLPAVYNPDEIAIMNRAMGLAQNGFNPHNFLYPSLYFYALFAWEGAWFAIGRVSGVFSSLAAFERSFFVDPTSIYLAGRLLTALCGVLTIATTWTLGRRLFGGVAGTAAALLLAVAPLAVRDAHYVKHDVPVTWLIVLACAAMARFDREAPSTRRTIGPSAIAGLAMSTHYYAVFLAVPLVLIVLLPRTPRPWRARLNTLALAAVVVTVAFVIGSPFLAVEPQTMVRDVVANREIVVDRATTASGLFGSLPFYLTWLVRDGVGWITAALAAVGVMIATRRDMRSLAIVLAFPIAFLLFIGNTVPASRYLNPIVPFVAVLAGVAVAWIAAQRGVWQQAAWILLLAAVTGGLLTSVRSDLFLRQTDTRTLALGWIARSVPDGASILVQPYSVPLRPSQAALHEALTSTLGSAERASVKFQRQLALSPYPSPSYRTIYLGDGGLDVDKIYVSPSTFARTGDLSPLHHLAVTYVVLKRYNAEDPSMAALSAALVREGRLLATFSPYRSDASDGERAATPPFLHNSDARIAPALERPGPIIDIWTID
jgi:hypothetical protein